MAKKAPKKAAKAKLASRPVQPAVTPLADLESVVAAEPSVSVARSKHSGLPVVGVGASAGGLDAFEKLFAAMPADSGLSFVLIPHLAPQHKSLMVDLIGRHSGIAVSEASDGAVLQANHVYVIPPNKYMTLSDGALRLRGPIGHDGSETTIDLFLRSLAEDKQEQAICIILSGSGARGAMGLKAVKAAGGMAMVQDPDTATFPDMPRSAIATDLADYVLPVEEMPAALIKYVQQYCINGEKHVEKRKQPDDDFNEVLAMVRAHTNVDFGHYHKQMLARRIERRMSLGHLRRISEYVKVLGENADELRRLSQDLLIGVTSFFRNPEAWQLLAAEVIAPLVHAREPGAPIRAWCPGCATGEEPYSLGILLLEQLAKVQKHCPINIFATDVDEQSLDVARRATYPETISADVSPERLSRYFTRVSDLSYQVSKPLREIVVFARQNLIGDPPLSRLDLVVCRNVLIYLRPDTQKRVIALFHFALNESGWLFLGPSETVGRNSDLFGALPSKWQIYRRMNHDGARRMLFSLGKSESSQTTADLTAGKRPAVTRLCDLAQNLLLRRLALAWVVINRNYEVLHFAGPTEDYLLQPAGPPTNDLLTLARPGLEAALRVVVRRAIQENGAQNAPEVIMRHGNASRIVNIEVEPLALHDQPEGLLLVTFQGRPSPAGEALLEARVATPTLEFNLIRQLELELDATREDLKSTIDELQSSNQDLKVSNEEILAMNEELQSANEELETSKEELQSLNEEFCTVNNQLNDKVADLETANSDMANLLNCTDIATVFLDSKLRIRRFTPTAARLFKVIPSDVGRSIGDIARRFDDDDLLADAERFRSELKPCEKEVRLDDGTWCLRRIIPYRTLDGRIDGMVFTFVDVTERKMAADSAVRRLAAIVENSADAIFSKDLDGTVRTWNKGAERLYGYDSHEMIGQSIKRIVPEDRFPEWSGIMDSLGHGKTIEQLETERIRKGGQRVSVALTYSPIRNAESNVVSISAIGHDITERKRTEQALRESEQRFRYMADAAPVMIWISDVNKSCTWFNRSWLDFVGRSMEQETGCGWMENIHPDDRDRCVNAYSTAFDARQAFRMEYRLKRHDGEYRWVIDSGIALGGASAEFTGYIGSCIDITERKVAEESLKDREERLRAILNTAYDAIITIDRKGTIQSVNPATEHMFGYAAAEMLGQNVSMIMPPPYQEEHDSYLRRYLETGEARIIGIGREIQAQRKDGSIFPIDLAISETKPLQIFTGMIRDITRRKDLEREVVEIASLEQRRISSDLHDTVGQELTALNLLARDLEESIGDPAVAGKLIAHMARGLQRCQSDLRVFIRGLLPVAVDREGLSAALEELAGRIEQDGQANCTFRCPAPVELTDNVLATHMYYIAQEAVHNAIKHAKCHEIRISLSNVGRNVVLSISDDGICMPATLPESHGVGLRIMRNRAAINGAQLTIEPAKPSGTVVTCTWVRTHHAQYQEQEA